MQSVFCLSFTRRRLRFCLVDAALAIPLALTLAACGGGGDDDTASASAAAALFDDHGSPAATAALASATPQVPQTRAGLYASAAQYRQEALNSSAYTVLIDVDKPGGERQAVDDAMAAHAWERSAAGERQAYFVRSSDRQAGVRVADALTARGLAYVFLLLDVTT